MATTFGVMGSGRRCRFFLRLAAAAPDRLRATGVVTRSAERGQEVTAQWALPAVRTLDELLAADRPDVVVAAVPWAQMPDAARATVALGVPVLVETPPAPDLGEMRALRSDVGGSGLVQVAEQSHLVFRRTGIDLNLEGNELDHVSLDGQVLYRNPFRGTRLSEDDIAVAAILEATGAWARDEAPPPYPLAQGCQDHAISLAIGESARTGRDVRVSKEVWA